MFYSFKTILSISNLLHKEVKITAIIIGLIRHLSDRIEDEKKYDTLTTGKTSSLEKQLNSSGLYVQQVV